MDPFHHAGASSIRSDRRYRKIQIGEETCRYRGRGAEMVDCRSSRVNLTATRVAAGFY